MEYPCILSVSTLNEENVIDEVKSKRKKKRKADDKKKRSVEDDLQKIGSEIGTGKTKPNRKTCKNQKLAEVRKVSPYFQNNYEKKAVVVEVPDHESDFESVTLIGNCGNAVQDKGEENGDEIAIEKIKSKRKKMSKKNEPVEHAQIRKVSPYFQNNYEKKAVVVEVLDHESDFESVPLIGNCGNAVENKGEEKIKSKRKRTSKKHEPVEHAQIRKVSPFFESDNDKVGADSRGYGIEIGSLALPGNGTSFLEDKLQENVNVIETGRIKSKTKKTTKKKAIDDKLQENGNDAKTSNVKPSKIKPKAEKNIDHVAVRYVSPYFHNDSGKKMNAKPLKRKSESIALPTCGNFMEDKLQENDSGKKIKQQELESHVDSGLQESGNEVEILTIKSKKRRKSKNQKTAEEHAKVQKVSPYFQKDYEKKKVNVEALDHESDFDSAALMGTCGKIVQEKVEETGDKIAIENIKPKEKRTSKRQEPVEHAQIRKVSPFFQNENGKNVDAELRCYGREIGSIASLGTGRSFLEDKLLENGNEIENGKIKSKRKKKKKAIADELQENGHDAETNNVKPKKTKPMVQKNIGQVAVRYVSPYFQSNIEKKMNVKSLDKESKSESTAFPSCGNFMEDKLQENDSKKKIKQQGLEIDVGSVSLTAISRDFFEDELQESVHVETTTIKSKKKRKTENQKTAEEHAEVRKVSPYFQNDVEKKAVNVEALDLESDFDSVVLNGACGIVQDKGEENGDKIAIEKIKSKGMRISKKHELVKHAEIRKVSPFFQSGNEKKVNAESHCYGSEIGSIALPGTSGSFLEDKLLDNGNEIENGNIKSNKKKKAIADKLQGNKNGSETCNVNSKKTRPEVEKSIAHAAVRCVSPYFQNNSGKKINVKPLDKESKSEFLALPTCGNFVEDKPEENDCGKKIKQQGLESYVDSVVLTAASGDFFENELQENGDEIETIQINSKKKRKTENQKSVEHVQVRKVSPYFQCLTGCEQVETAKNERKNLKVKDSRASVSSISSSLKVSPYFQKGPKVEDNTDFCLLENKSRSRKKSIKIKSSLSASEKWDEAYKRRTPDNTWKPPRSKIVLLQEDHAHDPWRVLVICMLLNRTSGLQEQCPSSVDVLQKAV